MSLTVAPFAMDDGRVANSVRIDLDVLIFGGGIAGLWLLDELRRAGYRVLLLESDALGAGQTVAAQGIIHGGLKYTLGGIFNPSADAIREMPALWRDCLRGDREPDLRGAAVRAEHCHLWRTESVTSQLGMMGARMGLRVKPLKLPVGEWPAALRGCPGEVFRLDEQVVDPVSVVAVLAERNTRHIRSYEHPPQFDVAAGSVGDGRPLSVLVRAADGRSAECIARTVVFAAGGGNGALRAAAELDEPAMQLRPLHMVVARGALSALNGHCTDGARTRVTITSVPLKDDQTLWQIGGQLAEDGVALDAGALMLRAAAELRAVLPSVDFDGVEWATYRVDRAEAATPRGRRPENVSIRQDGAIITAWPTKLALAPLLAARVRQLLAPPESESATGGRAEWQDWPRPRVAAPPWMQERTWRRVD